MSEGKVSIEAIKKLREITGVGMQDAQAALAEGGGDLQAAQDILRKKGVAKAAKKSSRATRQGIISSYVHGEKVGVLLEVNCETDFVAKTDDFRFLVHELALQIASMAPRYVGRSQVPADIVEKERSIFAEQVAAQGKPEAIVQKIIAGKLDKFFEEVCLLEQPSIKDPNLKISQLVTDAVAKLGENIVVSRFVRYQLGEEQ